MSRVRPLAGGFEAWRDAGYPLEPVPGPATAPREADGAAAAETGS